MCNDDYNYDNYDENYDYCCYAVVKVDSCYRILSLKSANQQHDCYVPCFYYRLEKQGDVYHMV